MTAAEEAIRVEPEIPFIDRLRAALVDTAGLNNLPNPRWLVDDFLPRNCLAWLQGKSGGAKTFAALDVAGCIAAGVHWHDRATVPDEPWGGGEPVLYIVAEGAVGIRKRVRAWEQAMGGPMHGVTFLPMAVQAGIPYQWDALTTVATELRPALIVVDTQARCTVGMDENSAQDMGRFVAAAESLRRATEATVWIVHHEGLANGRLRGSTALFGAADTVICTAKEDDVVTVSCPKQKDAPEFDDFELRLVQVDEHDSAVLVPNHRGSTGGQQKAAKAMARAWWDSFGNDWVSASKAVAAEISTKSSFYRNLRLLLASGVVVKDDPDARNPRYRLRIDPAGS